jgi:uncharacterized membrane protein
LTATTAKARGSSRPGRLQAAAGMLIAGLFRHWPLTLSSLAGSIAFVALAVTIFPDPYHTGWVGFFFRLLCHQKPERCFFLLGRQVPLCQRCLALYLGLWLGGVIFVLSRRKAGIARAWAPVAAWIPLFVDGVTQGLGFRESTPILRVCTGALAGIVLALFVLRRISDRMDQVERTVRRVFLASGAARSVDSCDAGGGRQCRSEDR